MFALRSETGDAGQKSEERFSARHQEGRGKKDIDTAGMAWIQVAAATPQPESIGGFCAAAWVGQGFIERFIGCIRWFSVQTERSQPARDLLLEQRTSQAWQRYGT